MAQFKYCKDIVLEKPILSICVVVYNHEKYISQALDGILNQKTKYKYEINILDDCSTDKTQEILKKYKELHPDKINLYLNESNMGCKKLINKYYYHCQSKYVCILEGDDYWVDSLKIEKQLDFLEANSDFVGCSHNTEVIFENEDKPSELIVPKKNYDEYSIQELTTASIYCHTSSYIYRNIFNGCLPDFFHSEEHCGDWFLSMLYAEHGSIKYLDEVMSVYRIISSGRWSSLSEIDKAIANIRAVVLYNKLLNNKYEENFLKIAFEGLSRLDPSKIREKDKVECGKIVKEIKRFIRNILEGIRVYKTKHLDKWELLEERLNYVSKIEEKMKNKALKKSR